MPAFIEPSSSIAEANGAARAALSFSDSADFADASRFQLAAPDRPYIPSRTDPERVVWSFDDYDFLDSSLQEGFPTVNPSLQRQGQLTRIAGLFHVVDDVYQVRGYDLSNMTIIKGQSGLVIIDPLASRETAHYALQLYRDATGDQSPVSAVLYTHSHVDHFGGVRGLFGLEGDDVPDIPFIAPDGFLEHAVSENIYAGPAMARRAAFMYAAALDKSPEGQVGSGLGLTVSTGEVTLIPPNQIISAATATPREQWQAEDVIPWRSGLTRIVVDGVRLVFQLTPGTEAPAEMNIYLPGHRALCMAENSTHTLHNLLTLRGAQVRDPHAWSTYLTEAIQTFAGHSDVEFASHHWPTWGKDNIVELLSNQRDVYAYLNDQTLRLINTGATGIEAAEDFELPESLAAHWYNRGYYGSVNHDVKAVYQRYIGWFDGNPAHLWNYPPTEAGRRYVDAIGGVEQLLAKAQGAYEGGDYRWVVELVNHAIFAPGVPDESLVKAKELQAQALTQLGYGAENGTWRNFFLTGAKEIVVGPTGTPSQAGLDLVQSLSLEQVFDTLAQAIDGPKAARDQLQPIALLWHVTEPQQQAATTTLRNGTLIHLSGVDLLAPKPQAVITLTRNTLNKTLIKAAMPGGSLKDAFQAGVSDGEISVSGDDPTAPATVFGYVTKPDTNFAIVTHDHVNPMTLAPREEGQGHSQLPPGRVPP
ncbi:alkyl/aryl-sulfatase [Streptomyces pinistramenti]|uniref:alkyl/aryl-sulfatase n=1 Tax=Streptomyces pinistramenti TaxID=2884812 RepID=UPI001D071CB5|nr:alkyl sulfatase dimerization domain-containing protein [Streptomyces pinistramenti]MCB5910024.1 MBL fold metallo-hydrolase [Streptomyces pinistramenti]